MKIYQRSDYIPIHIHVAPNSNGVIHVLFLFPNIFCTESWKADINIDNFGTGKISRFDSPNCGNIYFALKF